MESVNPHLIHFIWVSASPPGAGLLRQPGPVSSILMALLILALAAMLGGRLMTAIKQPAVGRTPGRVAYRKSRQPVRMPI
jgi:hypothetical protein